MNSNDSEVISGNDFSAFGDTDRDNSSLDLYDSVAVGGSSSYIEGYDWSNSTFCMTLIQLKSCKQDSMSFNADMFDLDNVDPSSIITDADLILVKLEQLEREADQHLQGLVLIEVGEDLQPEKLEAAVEDVLYVHLMMVVEVQDKICNLFHLYPTEAEEEVACLYVILLVFL